MPNFAVGADMTMYAVWNVVAESYEEAVAIIFDQEHPSYDEINYQDGFCWGFHQLQPNMETLELLSIDGKDVPLNGEK